MNSVKVRTIHRGIGISIAFFLFVQVIAGMLMSIGRLASSETSPTYDALLFIHAGWNPLGSIYRVALGLVTAMQAVSGFIIFRSLSSSKKKKDTAFSPSARPYASSKEAPMRALSFAADIRPLFRSYDVESMKPNGIDLSSYADVKKHAQDIYARLSAKDMPCDGEWNDGDLKKIKEWIEKGMQP